SIIAENQNTELATRAKLNNVYIALYNEDNISEAITTFNEVMKNTELSNPTELSLVHNAIETYGKTYGKEINGLSALPYFESTEEELGKQDGMDEETPNNYALLGNYPNPFNPSTIIKYELKESGIVKIKVYDILGGEVLGLVNEAQEAGYHSVNFNAQNLPSGVYIYTLQVNGFTASKKLLLLK
ncbi:MAG: T9SS type A sorting domain-containing protein, partial [Ignavibacteriaceae bacterium]